MKNRYNHHSLIFIRQAFIVAVILILISGSVVAQNSYTQLRESISNPAEIPDFHDFKTATITPGSTGKLEFKIKNRYEFSENNTMSNVTLWVEIYLFATLEENRDIQDISHAPKITGGNAALRTTTNQWRAKYYWPEIAQNASVPVELSIKSYPESPQGTYFIKMHLNFLYFSDNGSRDFNMLSRGHFNASDWDDASENIDNPDVTNDSDLIVGRLNLDILDVDGIIPDTSFRIKDPIPIWPLYVFVGGAIFFVILAVVFYYMDEKGKFPGTKKKLDEMGESVKNFRYRRK